jgi:hypothetical protein
MKIATISYILFASSNWARYYRLRASEFDAVCHLFNCGLIAHHDLALGPVYFQRKQGLHTILPYRTNGCWDAWNIHCMVMESQASCYIQLTNTTVHVAAIRRLAVIFMGLQAHDVLCRHRNRQVSSGFFFRRSSRWLLHSIRSPTHTHSAYRHICNWPEGLDHWI